MSLGASRTRTFFHVVLPLSLPGIAGGFILVFSIAISAYATPAILGGPATQVAATAIYNFIIQLLDWSLGAALAVVLIVCSLLLLPSLPLSSFLPLFCSSLFLYCLLSMFLFYSSLLLPSLPFSSFLPLFSSLFRTRSLPAL
jgi:hypothetical protein